MLNAPGDLTAEQLRPFIRAMKRYHPVFFFGGGEPFIREDIFEIFTDIVRCKSSYGVVTNGTLLTPEKIRRLVELEPAVVIFSVYGNAEIHDQITGSPGAFAKAGENLRQLLALRKKTTVILNSVINEKNYRILDSIVALGKSLGVDHVRFEHLVFITGPEYQRHCRVCRRRFPAEELNIATNIQDSPGEPIGEELKTGIAALRRKYGNFVVVKPYAGADELAQWYRDGFHFNRKCSFIRHSVFIKPNGDIIPCQFFPDYVLGNIKNDDFMSAWGGKKHRAFQKILAEGLLPGCVRCCKL
jgi:Predicted Fe-S oxidoreductases